MNQQQFERIKEILSPDPTALPFLMKWTDYVHLIDDMQDGDSPVNLGLLTGMANDLFSMPFYKSHEPCLWSVVQLTNNTFYDSVAWESAPEKWKRVHAGCLRHTGYDMFFIVVNIVAGYAAMREISLTFREYSHLKHLKDEAFSPEFIS